MCICNDKYSQKLKSLRNHTMELDYKRPTTQQISKRMLTIAQQEGLQALNSPHLISGPSLPATRMSYNTRTLPPALHPLIAPFPPSSDCPNLRLPQAAVATNCLGA